MSCRRAPFVRLALLGAIWSAGCTIQPPDDIVAAPLENSCEQDSDCVVGSCTLNVGRCSRHDTDFKAVLLEIVPPQSDRLFGGRSYFRRVQLGSLDEQLDVVLEQRQLEGRVTLWLGNCFGHSILFSLRRRSEALGLHSGRLAVESATLPQERENRDLDYDTRLNRFTLPAVPPGAYDVYFSGTGYEPLTPDCPAPAVPQLQRGLSILDQQTQQYTFDQTAPPPIELRVKVPFRPELQGWVVDVVHNITGERLSTQAVLDGSQAVVEDERSTVTVSIRDALVAGTDYRIPNTTQGVFQGGTLLRLRPPTAGIYPTVYFGTTVPTEPTASFEVSVPEIGPFSDLVNYRAWIRGDGDSHRPVRGRVILSASSTSTNPNPLSDVKALVSFTRTIDIGPDGVFEAALLPGVYEADVVPERGSGYGRYHTTLTVWGTSPSGDAGPVQAGRLVAVPEAPKLTGRVRGPGGAAPVGARVVAQAAARGGFTPPTQAPRFAPRSNELLVDDTGRFELEFDCSSCTEEAPVPFDVLVQPVEQSGLPWVVFRDVSVTGDLHFGRINMQVPRLLFGRVEFQDRAHLSPLPYAGPLVRAYAMLDRDGNVVEDASLPDCIDVEPPVEGEESLPCVQRVIQIGEVSTDRQGLFQLPLPPSFAKHQ